MPRRLVPLVADFGRVHAESFWNRAEGLVSELDSVAQPVYVAVPVQTMAIVSQNRRVCAEVALPLGLNEILCRSALQPLPCDPKKHI